MDCYLEYVQNGQNLSVVWDQRFAHHIARNDEMLQNLQDFFNPDSNLFSNPDLQRGANDRPAAGVERVLDRDDELRNHRQNL